MKLFIITFLAVLAASSASIFSSKKQALTQNDCVITTGNLFQTTKLITIIRPGNLKRTPDVDKNTALLVEAMGLPEDKVGYIIPQSAGGPGELWNLYPRVGNSKGNREEVEELERKLIEFVKKDGFAELDVHMSYFLSPKTTRPTFITYKINTPNNHFQTEITNANLN